MQEELRGYEDKRTQGHEDMAGINEDLKEVASSDRCFENLPSVTGDARMRRLYLHELE